MKNDSSVRLMTLLKFVNDQLATNEKRRIERIVRGDSEAFARMQQLRDAVSPTKKSLDVGLVKSIDEDQTLQRIAGFFDGTLGAEEEIAFESACWESKELLNDVIVLFQSGLTSPAVSYVDSNRSGESTQERVMRKRLVGLFPAEPSVTPKMNGTITAKGGLASQLTRSHNSHDELNEDPPVVVPRRPSKKQGRETKSSISTMIMIAIAVMVAIVAVSIVIANWNAMNTPPTIVVESPVESGIQDKPNLNPEVVRPEVRDSLNGDPESQGPERIVELENRSDLPRNPGQVFPNSLGPPSRDVGPPNGLTVNDLPKKTPSRDSVDPTAVGPDAQPMNIALSWDRVEGLVAIRTTDSEIWSGALALNDSRTGSGSESENDRVQAGQLVGLDCKVLPLSWVQASLKGLGTWTINENTDFIVASSPIRHANRQSAIGPQTSPFAEYAVGVKINLRRGRLAIANANVDSVVLIETTTGNWRIRITDPATVLIVEQGSQSRLLIQKGSVIANGTELDARQQLVRARDGRLEQTASRETVKWLKKPQHKFPNKQLALQWSASNDLFTDLSQPDVISPEDQPLVRAAFATIDPPGQAAKYLANVLPEVRTEGIYWLLAYGSDPQQLRVLAGELATELNTPGLRTTLPKLVIAIRRKRLPSRADADFLVTGLQNRDVSVRRFSHGFLVHLFGSIVAYDSDSDAATRNLQSRKWHAAVNRLYRRVENARRQ